MPRIPRPGENVPLQEGEAWLHDELPLEADHAIEKLILDADSWASDWRLRELAFETDARMIEHREYTSALRKVCKDYSNQVLKSFPLGVARWLAQETTNIFDDLPSQLFKRPQEGVRTANFAQENQFKLIHEEWVKQNNNPAFVLQALSIAKGATRSCRPIGYWNRSSKLVQRSTKVTAMPILGGLLALRQKRSKRRVLGRGKYGSPTSLPKRLMQV